MTAKGMPNAIRIVPMIDPKASVAHPPAPVGLTYRGGPLLSSVQIKTIFWGDAWNGAEATLQGQINAFFTYIVTSTLIDQLAEYNVPQYAIGHGAFVGSTVVAGVVAASVSDQQIQALVGQHPFVEALKSNDQVEVAHPPQPINNSLYFVFTPPGTTVTMGGGASCGAVNGFCGYHDDIGGTTFYAVIPYPGCAGCGVNTYTTLDAITMFASHEMCEAITDPVPGSGWYNDARGEIGDFCNQQPKVVGGYTVQKEWSNAAAACV